MKTSLYSAEIASLVATLKVFFFLLFFLNLTLYFIPFPVQTTFEIAVSPSICMLIEMRWGFSEGGEEGQTDTRECKKKKINKQLHMDATNVWAVWR